MRCMPIIYKYINIASGKVFYIYFKNYIKDGFFMGRSRNNTCFNFSTNHLFFYRTSVFNQGGLRVSTGGTRSMRHYSTSKKLNPFFVTGFVDAEGSFMVSVIRHLTYKGG